MTVIRLRTTSSMDAVGVSRCFFCNAALLAAATRRLLHPVTDANADVHHFFVTVVRPGHHFSAESVYACRRVCFANLAKAMRHHIALQELLHTLGSVNATCVDTATTKSSPSSIRALSPLSSDVYSISI